LALENFFVTVALFESDLDCEDFSKILSDHSRSIMFRSDFNDIVGYFSKGSCEKMKEDEDLLKYFSSNISRGSILYLIRNYK